MMSNNTLENDLFSTKLDKYIDLYKDEKIIKIFSRNVKSFYVPQIFRSIIFWIIFGTIWILVQKFFLYGTGNKTFFSIVGTITGIWLLIFVISMSVGKIFVKGHKYVLTSTRIILYRKFLGISFREIEYKRITDLVLYQSLWGRIWNYGNLLPVTAGMEMGISKMGRFSIEGVDDVFLIRNLLLTQIRKIQKQVLEDFQQKALNNKEKEVSIKNDKIK